MNAPSLNYLSPRLIRCLAMLSEREDYLTVNELAEVLKTSKRTLFREMKDINQILEGYGLNLKSKTGLGIRLEGSPEDRSQFKRLILQAGLNQRDFSKEDRQTVLLAELLKNKQLEKLVIYANQFQVSEATISHDINALEPQLNQYRLRLSRKPGVNLELEGSEEDIRKAILDFIYKNMEEDKFTSLLSLQAPWDIENYFKNQGPDSILQVLNKDILWQVITILKENDFFWVHRLAQNAYIGLILHLTIAIERIQNKEKIHMDQSLLDQLKQDAMFERVKDLSKYFEDEFNLTFPIEEVAYISMHLKGARLLYIAPEDEADNESEFTMLELQRMIFNLIAEFENVSQVRLKQDDLLVSGLLTHLRPALTRVRYHLEIRNPLLKQIRTQYRQVYEQAKAAVRAMPVEAMAGLNDDEIGYIALHFGAALERLNQQESLNRLKVAVLCASGIGISSLLASRIKRLFKDTLSVEPRSHLELKQLVSEDFDLVISTIDIPEAPIPVLHVNPLLNDEDVTTIQAEVNRLILETRHRAKAAEPTVSWDQSLNLISAMTGSIGSLLEHLSVEKLEDRPDIRELIRDIADHLAPHPDHVARIEADLNAREQMGSLILEDEEIAIFHARSKGIESPRMHLYVNGSKPFRAFGEKVIKTLLVLMVPDKAPPEINHWLSYLSAGLIDDPAYLEGVQSHDPGRLRREVNRILEPPVKEWLRKQVNHENP